MRRTPRHIAAVLAALTLSGVATAISSTTAQQPACLKGQDEAAAQQTRRRGALALTRQLNSYEVVAKQRTQTYQSPYLCV